MKNIHLLIFFSQIKRHIHDLKLVLLIQVRVRVGRCNSCHQRKENVNVYLFNIYLNRVSITQCLGFLGHHV